MSHKSEWIIGILAYPKMYIWVGMLCYCLIIKFYLLSISRNSNLISYNLWFIIMQKIYFYFYLIIRMYIVHTCLEAYAPYESNQGMAYARPPLNVPWCAPVKTLLPLQKNGICSSKFFVINNLNTAYLFVNEKLISWANAAMQGGEFIKHPRTYSRMVLNRV